MRERMVMFQSIRRLVPDVEGMATCVIVVALCGCGGDSRPVTIPVSGRVTYQGEPVPKGTITFGPLEIEEGRPHRSAISFLDEDGRYEMATFSHGDGVIPGTYRVWILSSKRDPTAYPHPRMVEWLVPIKYTQATSSELTVEVPADADGPLERNFDLVD